MGAHIFAILVFLTLTIIEEDEFWRRTHFLLLGLNLGLLLGGL